MKPFVLPPGRIKCEVLGCRRTAKEDPDQPDMRIVCGKCWRAASTAEERRTWSKFRREADRLDARLSALHDAGQPIPDIDASRYERCVAGAHKIFDLIAAKATAAATGI